LVNKPAKPSKALLPVPLPVAVLAAVPLLLLLLLLLLVPERRALLKLPSKPLPAAGLAAVVPAGMPAVLG
jgi:hypothetical protein